MPLNNNPNASAATIPQKIARPRRPTGERLGPVRSVPKTSGAIAPPKPPNRIPISSKKKVHPPPDSASTTKPRNPQASAPTNPPTTARPTAHPHSENLPSMARLRDRRAPARFAGRLHEEDRALSRH